MNIFLTKTKKKKHTIRAISSKSYSIRALVCAFLSKEDCFIENISICDDTLVTIACLRKLGAKVKRIKNKVYFSKIDEFRQGNITLNVKASATLLRFLIALNLVINPNNEITYLLDNSLVNRPLDGFESLFLKNNIKVSKIKNRLIIKGSLQEELIEVDGSASSQFVSALLIALVNRKVKSKLVIHNLTSSIGYVDMTIKVMKAFGVDIELNKEIDLEYMKFKSSHFAIEGDYSNATLLMLISTLTSKTTFTNLDLNSLQPDSKIVSILKSSGAKIKIEQKKLTIYKSPLDGFNVDVDNCIDLAPLLMAMSLTCKNKSIFKNVRRLRLKESDRLKAILDILDKIHANYEFNENNDSLTIYPSKVCYDGVLESYDDHRIVFALIIISLINNGHLEIKGFNAINKSYPSLVSDLSKLGIDTNENLKPDILISIRSLDDLKLPSDGYVLGYEKYTIFAPFYFNYEDVKKSCKDKTIYLLLNAMIHENNLDDFKLEINKLIDLPIKFIVQDLGALNYLLKVADSRRIIFMPYTLICSTMDALMYDKLNLDAIGLSNEITLDDIYKISRKVPSFVTIFGHNVMYQSYRKILSLYEDYHHKTLIRKTLRLKEDTRDEFYFIQENRYGSSIFRDYISSYLSRFELLENVKYLYLDQSFIDQKSFNKIIIALDNFMQQKLSFSKFMKNIDNLNLNIKDGFMYKDSVYLEK